MCIACASSISPLANLHNSKASKAQLAINLFSGYNGICHFFLLTRVYKVKANNARKERKSLRMGRASLVLGLHLMQNNRDSHIFPQKSFVCFSLEASLWTKTSRDGNGRVISKQLFFSRNSSTHTPRSACKKAKCCRSFFAVMSALSSTPKRRAVMSFLIIMKKNQRRRRWKKSLICLNYSTSI